MSDKLQTVDVTALQEYLRKVEDISSINKMMGPTYLRDFVIGQDIANNMLARAIQQDIRAKARLDQARSIAYLDKASDYIKDRGLKDSNGMREMYVDLDPDVIEASDNKARTEAMVHLLKGKSSILRQAHDDLKKILYGETHMTAYEGM